jgi:hypothetical protein
MIAAVSPDDSERKKTLSRGIAFYLVFWAMAFLILSVGFGVSWAATLSLLLAVPPLIAVCLRFREGPIRDREMAYLLVTAIFVFVGSIYIVSYWHDIGIDEEHARYNRFMELTHVVHDDAAFRKVELTYTPFKIECGLYRMQGTVASKADLGRLRSLAEQYGFLSEMSDVNVSENSIKGGN